MIKASVAHKTRGRISLGPRADFCNSGGVPMNRSLTGRVILIAEDEPQIAFEMTLALEDEGALVIRAHTLKQALAGVEDPKLSAAILDHALSDGDTSAVCERM